MKAQAAKNSQKKSRSRKKTKESSKWPLERNILWRPHRFAYLQGQTDKGVDCVFCDARSKGLKPETLVLHESGTAMVVLNKFPYNNGHLLVLPTRHVADLEGLNETEFVELHKMVRKCVVALRKAYEKAPPGMNVGANLGAAAGAGIPQHLHYHIIPRWIGDANFFPIVGQTKVISETLEQTYKRLLPYFE